MIFVHGTPDHLTHGPNTRPPASTRTRPSPPRDGVGSHLCCELRLAPASLAPVRLSEEPVWLVWRPVGFFELRVAGL